MLGQTPTLGINSGGDTIELCFDLTATFPMYKRMWLSIAEHDMLQYSAKPVSLRLGDGAPSAPRTFTEVKQAVDLASVNHAADPSGGAVLLFSFDIEKHNAKPKYLATWLSVAEKMVEDGLGGAQPILLHVIKGSLSIAKSAHGSFADLKAEVQLMSHCCGPRVH